MTERLSDVLRANREFAANASHQLRTPLTALRLSLEEAVEGDDPRTDARTALGEADRLALIVQSLLALGADREPSAEPIEVAEVARSVVDERPLRGVTVVVRGEGYADAGRDRLEQVLGNLVDNAVRFARGQVRVDISRDADRVMVRVDDDGPGVPDAERTRVFDRFTRGGEPRGQGSGLGLAVARELASVDGASISIGDSELGGARFELNYPAARLALVETGRT
jgi:two-component system, OmpR family, sensor kinase